MCVSLPCPPLSVLSPDLLSQPPRHSCRWNPKLLSVLPVPFSHRKTKPVTTLGCSPAWISSVFGTNQENFHLKGRGKSQRNESLEMEYQTPRPLDKIYFGQGNIFSASLKQGPVKSVQIRSISGQGPPPPQPLQTHFPL